MMGIHTMLPDLWLLSKAEHTTKDTLQRQQYIHYTDESYSQRQSPKEVHSNCGILTVLTAQG